MNAPRSALTMVELVVVLLIVGIMAAAIAPKMVDTATSSRVQAVALTIAADIEMAAQRAKELGKTQTVNFTTASDTYELLNMQDIDHPGEAYSVDLTDSQYNASLSSSSFGSDGTASSITFNRFGRPDYGGSVEVTVSSKQRTVLVDGVSGKVTVQP